jgi:hypothetical protein
VDDERVDGIALILRAIDLTIADVEAGDAADRDEQLAILGQLRERWLRRAVDESGG